MSMKPRILVTGARLPAALEIARALEKEGAEVWAADTLYCTPAGFSRSVKKYLQIPSPALQPAEFREAIRKIVAQYRIELVIPASEEIFYLAQMQDERGLGCRLFSPAFTALKGLHSQWNVMEMARDCGIYRPHSVLVTSREMLRPLLAAMPDYVLKAEYPSGSLHTIFPPHNDVAKLPIGLNQPWLLQLRVSGRDISIYAIAVDGRVLAATVYQPRYRIGRGVCLYLQPVDARAAEDFVAAFVEKHHLTGQISFDLMQCNDGRLALLACNPRATSGVHLFAPASRWARAFFGKTIMGGRTGKVDVPVSPRAAKAAVVASYFLPALRSGNLSSLWSDLLACRDICFSGNDPLPSLGSHLGALEIRWRSRAWPDKAGMFDIEWNGDSE